MKVKQMNRLYITLKRTHTLHCYGYYSWFKCLLLVKHRVTILLSLWIQEKLAAKVKPWFSKLELQLFCRVAAHTYPPLKTLRHSSVCREAGLTSAFSLVSNDAPVELSKARCRPSVPTPQRQKYGPESAKKAVEVWRKAAFCRHAFADGASVAL